VDILLTTINAKWIHPSLALRLLKANLGEWEDRAEIREFALRQPLEEKTGPILAAAPRILGISVSVWNHRGTVELLRALETPWEAAGGRPLIILGGPEVSYLPEEAEIIRRADWVIRGEGEEVFRELCALFLKGGGSRPPEGMIRSLPPVREVQGKFIEGRPVDLAAIDPGYRLYTGEDLCRKLVYVEASRGCPFGCAFCQSSVPVGGDRKVREFPLDNFLREMAALIDRGGRAFKFLDRSFNLDIGRARRIMEFFGERLPFSTPAGGAYVHFEMVPSRFPPELREIIARFPPGSLRLEIGLQTFNAETSRLINRSGDPEQELEVLRFLKEHTQAIVHADLIAGLPGEDLDSFARGFDRLRAAAPAEIQLGILKGLPGTPILRHNRGAGMVYAPDPPYEVQETAALSRQDLDRLKNFARFWELIVHRGAFEDLVPSLLPEGEPVFHRFLALSDRLLAHFGRNWGIDRQDLRAAL
jgi:radical SAM superfamily enzyme YgiQ (UPF0313 family)